MTGRPAHTAPDRWTPAYTLCQRIDTATETLGGIALSIGLIAACGLIRAAQIADDARTMWAEDRAHRRAARREAWDGFGCIEDEEL